MIKKSDAFTLPSPPDAAVLRLLDKLAQKRNVGLGHRSLFYHLQASENTQSDQQKHKCIISFCFVHFTHKEDGNDVNQISTSTWKSSPAPSQSFEVMTGV